MEPEDFVLSDWLSLEDKPRSTYWNLLNIVGPCDARRLSTMRELALPYMRFGEPAYVDMFLLSVGSAASRKCTHVGGLPFWPEDRPWPLSTAGEPLRFLAQFNFSASFDLLGALPGNILLVFRDESTPDGFVIEWEDDNKEIRLIGKERVPFYADGPSWFGHRWRVATYPNASPMQENYWSRIQLPNGQHLLDLYLVTRMLGLQIGSTPFIPPCSTVERLEGRIVCSLSSICPTAGRPYPFVNIRGPLTEADAHNLSLELVTSNDDSFGIVYIVECKDGSFKTVLSTL